jgi:hypothetical protein
MKMRKKLSKGRKTEGSGSLVKLAKKLRQKQSQKKVEQVTDDSTGLPVQYRRVMPYTAQDSILLVGEGNFSFMTALVQLFASAIDPPNVLGTCYDSEKVLHEKYGDESRENIDACVEAGYDVMYEIDGTVY